MLFLSLYTPATKPSGPPSAEKMAEMGALIEKFMKEGTLVQTGPLGKSGPGGLKVRFKIKIATGREARELDARQAEAIWRLLQWAQQNKHSPDPG